MSRTTQDRAHAPSEIPHMAPANGWFVIDAKSSTTTQPNNTYRTSSVMGAHTTPRTG